MVGMMVGHMKYAGGSFHIEIRIQQITTEHVYVLGNRLVDAYVRGFSAFEIVTEGVALHAVYEGVEDGVHGFRYTRASP